MSGREIPVDPGSPHRGGRVAAAGAGIASARAALLLVHGRGASAESILDLGLALRLPGLALLAPQAHGSTWYPYPFLAPLERNEPFLSSALAALGELVERVEAAGIDRSRIVLAGFSQGACLALEWLARHPRPRAFAGVAGLAGGLIGPPAPGVERRIDGDLEGTPILLGCSDRDPHIPVDRVRETARAFSAAGAAVDLRLYPGLGHEVNADELGALRDLAQRALLGATGAAARPANGGTPA